MKTKFYYLACLLLIQVAARSQMKIGTNPTTINSASLLELESTNQGFVLPRVSISDVSSSSPLNSGLISGTLVYNNNSGTTGGSGVGIYLWDGTKWVAISTGSSVSGSAWLLTGNSGLSSSTNFIGTTDAVDFVARTNNIERMRILGLATPTSQAGWVGIGTSSPRSLLDVTGSYTNKNVFTIQNTSSTGFSSIDMLDNTGSLKGTFGYANTGTGGSFGGRTFFNSYGNDLLFTANSGTYHLFLKGGTGFIGINTNTPTERLHVVGNIYLNGAFMPGGLPGTAGNILTSAGAGISPTWSSLNGLAWSLTGNSATSYATNFIGTTDNVSMRFRTNNVQRMIIDSVGKVGIGLNNPSNALSVLSPSNPLYLSGVQATTTFSTDSVLTINAGVVKKTPYSSFTNNFWSLTGNNGTSYATNFLGTTDNVSLRFRTNNTERMIIDSLGSVGIGSSAFNSLYKEKLLIDYGTTTSHTLANLTGSINDYFQINLQNKSNGTGASTDYVATSDDGTDSTYYIDLGINSSTYAPGVENFGGPHDAYLYTYGRNLLIGAAANNSDIIFLLGGGRLKNNAIMRLNSSDGHVIIGSGEASTIPVGTTLRGPNAISSAVNLAGGSLTLSGGSSTGTATGGALNLYGGGSGSGTWGALNINASTNSATNINTGTSTSTVTIGNLLNNINLPKLSASSVVLTDASRNLTSTTPTSNTYLYYNGTSFIWSAAATLGSFSATLPLTYNSTTGVFAINQSTSSTDGYLSSTDWNTFNNKVGSITLNTPSSVFSNPINFSVTSGAATGTLSLNTQTAGTVFAGPVNVASGTLPAVPTFRALVATDIPSLGGLYIQNQTTLQASSNFNISGNGTIGTNLMVTGKSTLNGTTNTGTLTTSGGDVSINVNSNNSTNINTGTSTSNVTIGNANNNILLPKLNTTGGLIYTTAATGQIASTASNMIWDNTNSRLGIGTASPSNKLSVLAASDPLYLSGVQATSTFSSDSILTINAGVVKKTSISSLSGIGNWSLTGNSGTTAGINFIGTTDAVDFVVKTNGTERMRVTSGGFVGIGTNAPVSDLTIYQSSGSGSSKGFTFTGNSIGGTSSGTGFLMSLGYNTASNKQLWLGDADYAGSASGSFARFVSTGTAFPVFDAVSGNNASRRYLALGVAGDPNSGVIFGGDNTAVNPGSQVWDNGNMTIGSSYKSYAAPSNGLLVQGNVGIGTTSPSSALSVLASSNPLYLSGVQATSTFTTDSILTILNGIVKKAPYSSLPSGGSGSGWLLSGNTVASGNYLGTNNAFPLILKALGNQMAYFDGNVFSIALGYGAVNNSSDHNVAIGYNASTNNQYTLALGYNASASGVRSVAIGNGSSATTASGSESIAMGYNANANNAQTVAIGYQAQATGQYGVALGYNPTASGLQSLAIGYQAQATQQYSNAIGYQAQATGSQSTAIGYNAQTAQSNTILLGNPSASGGPSVGIGIASPTAKLHIVGVAGTANPLQIVGLPTGTFGTDNLLTINSSGVVGYLSPSTVNGNFWTLSGNAAASGNFLGTTNSTPLQFKFNSTNAGYLDANNTSFGTSATSTSGSNNTAIGYSSNAANSATALGASSVAANVANTAIGNSALANNSDHETAIGASSLANSQYNTALGYNAQAISNSQATAIGTTSTANGYQSTALGYGAQAINNAQTTALGVNSVANAQYNTAVGYNAQAISNSQTTAIGTNSTANSQYSTALGYNAQALTNSYGTAIGTSSTTSGQYATAIGGQTDATTQFSTALGYNAQAVTGTQTTSIGSNSIANANNATSLGYNAKAQGTNSTAIGYNALTSQNNALVLGDATSTVNVGIGTSTPNTSAKLDVAGSFKLGTAGSVLGSVIKSSVTISPTVNLGTTTTYTATVTGAATGASVIVNPRSTLANGVVIAYSYVSGVNTITIALTSGSTTGALGSLTFDVTVIQ